MIKKRKISLTPEIGDWTLLQPKIEEDITIGNVGVSDFDRLSVDQMELAHKLHYQASEKLSSYLRNEMKVKFDLYYVEALQLSYGDFSQTIAKEKMVHVIVSLGGSFEISLYLSRNLANAFLERSLGGKCVSSNNHLTSIEEKAFEIVAKEVVNPLLSLCNIDVEDIVIKDVSDMVVENLILSPQSTYNCYVSKLSVANNEPGFIKFCYDRNTLVMLLSRYTIVNKRKNNVVVLDDFTKNDIELNLNVELGSAMILMKDLKNLSEGDVIALDRPLNQPLNGSISDKVSFIGYPGFFNGNISIQIAELEQQKNVVNNNITFELPSVSKEENSSHFAMQNVSDEKKDKDTSDVFTSDENNDHDSQQEINENIIEDNSSKSEDSELNIDLNVQDDSEEMFSDIEDDSDNNIFGDEDILDDDNNNESKEEE